MKALLLCAATYLSVAPARADEVVRKVEFAVIAREHTWSLKDLAPGLPRDWTPYRFLVMELRASSPQRFDLLIHTGGAVRGVGFHPFEGAWVRASVPLARFRETPRGNDLASMGNKPRGTFWVSSGWNIGPLADVQSIGVRMNEPVGSPALELRSVRLEKDDPGDALLEPKPVVDEFGQWIPADWPGKARSLDDLKAAWFAEAETLRGAKSPDSCRWGGSALEPMRKATGFFRVENVDGRWWFVCPGGHLFFSAGADVITPYLPTPTEGRGDLFTMSPPPESSPAGGSRRGPGASFFSTNLARRFGEKWAEKWAEMTVQRMNDWGLNTVGSWSDPRLWASGRIPYTVILDGLGTSDGTMGLPDVYDPAWQARVERSVARQCGPRKGDSFLLGYFLGNEPAWPGREAAVAELIRRGPETATRRELEAFLKEGDTAERRKAFVYKAYDRMLGTVIGAVRQHDPNHLVLGIRYGGMPPEDAIRAGKVFDVFSINIYRPAPESKTLDAIARLTGRPILIGEFHNGAPGRGMDAGLVPVRDQAERGVAYRYFVENAAAHPSLIGAHWFQWADEPNTGRFDGENYNIGFVDVTDRPYADLVAAMKGTHRGIGAVHSGKRPPTNRKPAAR